MALDYDNFKNEVANKHIHTWATIYHYVWQDCRKIANVVSLQSEQRPGRAGKALVDRTDEYRMRNLHAEGEWPASPKPRYGAVIFDRFDRVLLREPMGHFDDYHWTFSKGASLNGEHPVDTALRETLEDWSPSGDRRSHSGWVRRQPRWSNRLLLPDERCRSHGERRVNAEERRDEGSCFGNPSAGRELISHTTNVEGKARDLRTLDGAFKEWWTLVAQSPNRASES